MKMFRSRSHRIWMRLIAFTVITVFLSQEITWAVENNTKSIHKKAYLASRSLVNYIQRYEGDAAADSLGRAMNIDYAGRRASKILFERRWSDTNEIKPWFDELRAGCPDLRFDIETILLDKRSGNTALCLGTIKLRGKDRPVIISLFTKDADLDERYGIDRDIKEEVLERGYWIISAFNESSKSLESFSRYFEENIDCLYQPGKGDRDGLLARYRELLSRNQGLRPVSRVVKAETVKVIINPQFNDPTTSHETLDNFRDVLENVLNIPDNKYLVDFFQDPEMVTGYLDYDLLSDFRREMIHNIYSSDEKTDLKKFVQTYLVNVYRLEKERKDTGSISKESLVDTGIALSHRRFFLDLMGGTGFYLFRNYSPSRLVLQEEAQENDSKDPGSIILEKTLFQMPSTREDPATKENLQGEVILVGYWRGESHIFYRSVSHTEGPVGQWRWCRSIITGKLNMHPVNDMELEKPLVENACDLTPDFCQKLDNFLDQRELKYSGIDNFMHKCQELGKDSREFLYNEIYAEDREEISILVNGLTRNIPKGINLNHLLLLERIADSKKSVYQVELVYGNGNKRYVNFKDFKEIIITEEIQEINCFILEKDASGKSTENITQNLEEAINELVRKLKEAVDPENIKFLQSVSIRMDEGLPWSHVEIFFSSDLKRDSLPKGYYRIDPAPDKTRIRIHYDFLDPGLQHILSKKKVLSIAIEKEVLNRLSTEGISRVLLSCLKCLILYVPFYEHSYKKLNLGNNTIAEFSDGHYGASSNITVRISMQKARRRKDTTTTTSFKPHKTSPRTREILKLGLTFKDRAQEAGFIRMMERLSIDELASFGRRALDCLKHIFENGNINVKKLVWRYIMAHKIDLDDQDVKFFGSYILNVDNELKNEMFKYLKEYRKFIPFLLNWLEQMEEDYIKDEGYQIEILYELKYLQIYDVIPFLKNHLGTNAPERGESESLRCYLIRLYLSWLRSYQKKLSLITPGALVVFREAKPLEKIIVSLLSGSMRIEGLFNGLITDNHGNFYMLKKGDVKAEKLAYLLGKDTANIAEVVLPQLQQVAGIGAGRGIPADEIEKNYLLSRVYLNDSAEFKWTGKAAKARQLVFEVFVRKYDPILSNEAMVNGTPMFFDNDKAFVIEYESIEDFLHDYINSKIKMVSVDDIDLNEAMKAIEEYQSLTEERIRAVIKEAKLPESVIDRVTDFLKSNRDNLKDDVCKTLVKLAHTQRQKDMIQKAFSGKPKESTRKILPFAPVMLGRGFKTKIQAKEVHVRGISPDPRIIGNYISALRVYEERRTRVIPKVHRVYVPLSRIDLLATAVAREIVLKPQPPEILLPYTISLLREAEDDGLFEVVELRELEDYYRAAQDLGIINEKDFVEDMIQDNLILFVSDWIGPNVYEFIRDNIDNEESMRRLGAALGFTLAALHNNGLIAGDTYLGQFVVQGDVESVLRIDLENIYSLDQVTDDNTYFEYREISNALSSRSHIAQEAFQEAYTSASRYTVVQPASAITARIGERDSAEREHARALGESL